MSIIRQMTSDEMLVGSPPWMADGVIMEGLTGSTAYGCSEDESDRDLLAIALPPKHILFPHLTGYIRGFGEQPPHFEQYQKHHLEYDGYNYDLTVFSIVQFFNLCARCNPNMIDNLFLPRHCILYSTPIYEYIRDHRHKFLSQEVWVRFVKYAYSQLKRLRKPGNKRSEKRKEYVRRFGYDTKFAYNIVRLALECEQILSTGDLVLDQHRETYRKIRQGEWTLEHLEGWFADKEIELAEVHAKSQIPHKTDKKELHRMLKKCLEMHYGDLSREIPDTKHSVASLVVELEALVKEYSRPEVVEVEGGGRG